MNGAALPSDRETVNRLAAIAARDDPQSQTIIHRYATGLPDAAIARTIESYLGRRPRPRNPAGYVVSTLKSLRAEYGLETATIDQEPDL